MAAENKKSTFVNVLAWIGIVFAGFGTFISFFQNIMFHFLLPHSQMEQLMNESNSSVQVPEMARFMISHLDIVFLASFIVSLFVLTASIGLLKRKNWARIVIIVFLALGVLWNFGSIFFQRAMMQDLPLPQDVPPEFQLQMENMMSVMSIISVIFALVFSVVYIWMIWKLRSPQIVKEFRNEDHLNA